MAWKLPRRGGGFELPVLIHPATKRGNWRGTCNLLTREYINKIGLVLPD